MVLNWPADAIILHIPHASTILPTEVEFLLGHEALAYEVDAMTDHHTDRLFDLPGAHRCVFPVSRLVVDPERFIDDPMECVGMGVVYTHTAAGEALRAISQIDRLALINSYYPPHHTALTRMADECLEKHNQCLIIDCHSFPAQPLPYENDLNRPDICFKIYFDAKLLEVTSICKETRINDSHPLINDCSDLAFQFELNLFMLRWLDYCLDRYNDAQW